MLGLMDHSHVLKGAGYTEQCTAHPGITENDSASSHVFSLKTHPGIKELIRLQQRIPIEICSALQPKFVEGLPT